MSKHLFVLDWDAIKATGLEDLQATVDGLREMDLFHLPFSRDVYIQIDDKRLEGAQLLYGPYGYDQGARAVISGDGIALSAMDSQNEEVVRGSKETCAYFMAILIVLLATKNTVKTTTVNKLARLGIGKKRNAFASTTRISLPHELPDDPDHPSSSGAAKCAHLRRGHIRRQHYGKENAMEKKIWIASVFVNADPEFVSSQHTYKFSKELVEHL